MSAQDNNLLGFLKKKSLFNQSPVRHPNGKRSRSKSKDLKESIIRKINEKDIDEEQPPRFYQNNHSNQIKKEPVAQRNFHEKEFKPLSMADQTYKRQASQFVEPTQNSFKPKTPEDKFDFSVSDRNNKFLAGLTSYSTTFESARIQSAQILQTLSLKLGTEISNINYRIDQFRENISRVLTSQLKNLKDQVLHLVDEAFKETERSIRQYIKLEEQKLAVDLMKVREGLERQYVKVETMKEEINRPQWRKVTGEILATELEKSLQELVKKSQTTDVGRWQKKNFGGQRLKTLQHELRDLVRLKE